jgi:hypothetical protein
MHTMRAEERSIVSRKSPFWHLYERKLMVGFNCRLLLKRQGLP